MGQSVNPRGNKRTMPESVDISTTDLNSQSVNGPPSVNRRIKRRISGLISRHISGPTYQWACRRMSRSTSQCADRRMNASVNKRPNQSRNERRGRTTEPTPPPPTTYRIYHSTMFTILRPCVLPFYYFSALGGVPILPFSICRTMPVSYRASTNRPSNIAIAESRINPTRAPTFTILPFYRPIRCAA